MTAHRATHRLATLCRVLGVSPSGYYAWQHRPLSARGRADVTLGAQIQAIHRHSRGTYGVPRVHAELAADGVPIGRKRVARLMRAADNGTPSSRSPKAVPRPRNRGNSSPADIGFDQARLLNTASRTFAKTVGECPSEIGA